MMNCVLSRLLVIFVSSATLALAAEPKAPSLLGTWKGTHSISYLKEVGKVEEKLVVTSQDGANFAGYIDWKRLDVKRAGREPIAGVIGFDGKTIVIAQEDGGKLMGELTGPKTMQLLMTQGGKGLRTIAYRETLTKQ
jgi:hypothetical protein